MKELVKFIGIFLIGCVIFFLGYWVGQRKAESNIVSQSEGVLEVISNYKTNEKEDLQKQVDSLERSLKVLESRKMEIDTLLVISRERIIRLPLDSATLYFKDKLKAYEYLLENNCP